MSDNPRLKITDVRSVKLKLVEHVGEIEPAWNPGRFMSMDIGGGSFIEVHTDQGLTGIGPAVHDQFIPGIKEYLIGKDPFDVEDHAAALNYYIPAFPYQGVAGVDIALWDLIGKASGQPLYKLWGGGRDKMIPYASMIQLSTPEERSEMAAELKSQGCRRSKYASTTRPSPRTSERSNQCARPSAMR